ncbi:MAG: type II secretion system inner membrane protein GspF [Pseudomonadota bacterium]
MPVYEYKGIDQKGKEVSGIIDADSARTARARLRKAGTFPTEVTEQRSSAAPKASGKGGQKKVSRGGGKGLSFEIDFSRTFQVITRADVATMTSQLSTLVGASIPMVEALAALVEQVEKPALKVVLSDIKEKVNEGSSLAKALSAHPKIFDDLYVNMVAAGEQSGALDKVLDRLTQHTESMLALRSKVTSALIYPMLMAAIGSGLLTVIMLVVVPKVRRLFDSFGKGLPLPTKILLNVSQFCMDWWWLISLLLALVIFLWRRWVKTEKGHATWDRWMLKLPIMGPILRIVAVSRFCRTFSTLLASGVPILSALNIVKRVVGNVVLSEAIEKAAENIREGQSVAVPLRQSGEFPPLVTHMIAIGERTGELEPMLEKVANAYDAATERALSTMTSLLEPLLILVMGGTIGATALALLLPMMQMSKFAGS